ncbi:MAG: hypothetical protein L6E13_01500 [Firmicutes bacterium]|nr:hypothetical protein [Bacillota bacterium]
MAKEAALANQEARDAELKAIYNAMKPEAIAEALKAMSDPDALYILRLLDPDRAADVLRRMEPSRVARLTQRWMPAPAR